MSYNKSKWFGWLLTQYYLSIFVWTQKKIFRSGNISKISYNQYKFDSSVIIILVTIDSMKDSLLWYQSDCKEKCTASHGTRRHG